ncbi:MAG: LrgB family protein [Bacteroidota bacterium]
MNEFLKTPLISILITLGIYVFAQKLFLRFKSPFLNPVLLSICTLIFFLKISGIEYAEYIEGGKFISFLLSPAVVALGAVLYSQRSEIFKKRKAILISVIAGSCVGIMSAAGIAILLKANPQIVATLAPKSVTAPIAIEISRMTSGIPSLTAAICIAVGVFGAVVGPMFLKLLKIKSGAAWGFAMGAAAHGIGTARALEEGELEGAAAGLAIGLNGILTAILTPILLKLFGIF